MRVLKGIGLLLLLGVMLSPARAEDTIEIDPNSHGAIAYSPSTGRYGYAFNYRSRAEAEKAALGFCKADDAQIAGWVNFGFVALVKGEDGAWGAATSFGDGSSNTDALRKAEKECRKHTNTKISVACIISSDGQYLVKK